MANIIEFLEARITEDEEAEASKFRYSNEKVTAAFGECSVETHGDGRVVVRPWDGTIPFSVDPAEFRALYADPAPDKRMLAECEAKRAILSGSHWEPRERPTDSELHFRSSHPAYQYKTTEGQRKAWDDADEPPEGEGWERNTDSGRDGWDRFEFHEESYWRRLKPESERKEWKQWIPKELRAIATVYKDHPDYQQDWAL